MKKMFQRILETIGNETLVKNANLGATIVNMVGIVNTRDNVNE